MYTRSGIIFSLSRAKRTAALELRISASLIAFAMTTLAAAGYTNPQSGGKANPAQKSIQVSSLPGDKFTVNCSNRSLPYENVYAQRYSGYHKWTSVASSLRWDSDAPSAIKDFLICECKPKVSTSGMTLSWTGGEIRFANKDASGSGGGLMLAIYEDAVPPSLFKGKDIDLQNPKPLYSNKWLKSEKQSVMQLGRVSASARFSPKASKLFVVFAGVDPWFDTRVTITINGVYVDTPASLNRAVRRLPK